MGEEGYLPLNYPTPIYLLTKGYTRLRHNYIERIKPAYKIYNEHQHNFFLTVSGNDKNET